MALEWTNMVVSMGKVTAATPPVQTAKSRGGVLARTSAGVWTLTLDEPLPASEGLLSLTPLTSVLTAFNLSYADTSDTVKTITANVNGAAADIAFSWVAFRFPAG